MQKTKRKILNQALSLFNEKGLPNVKLQHIADSCEISVGNLAYHFKFKEDLIVTIADQISEELTPIFKEDQKFPSLIDFDNHLSIYHSLINKYGFFFLDVVELKRTLPSIHHQRVKNINMMIAQIHQWISVNVAKGVFQAEIHDNQYDHTAHAIWMLITFWMTQKKVLSKDGMSEEHFKIVVWNQLLPNFTEIGLMEYEAMILPQLRAFEMDAANINEVLKF